MNRPDNAELRFLDFFLRSLDEHVDAREDIARGAPETDEQSIDGDKFYAGLYSAWAGRVGSAAGEQGNVVPFKANAGMLASRAALIAQSVVYMPRAAAAATEATSIRRLTTRDGQTVGTIECIDSGDEASFYLVLRFAGAAVAWAGASLVVFGKSDEAQESIRLGRKAPGEQVQQLVLDRGEHRAIYSMLRDPASEAVIVDSAS